VGFVRLSNPLVDQNTRIALTEFINGHPTFDTSIPRVLPPFPASSPAPPPPPFEFDTALYLLMVLLYLSFFPRWFCCCLRSTTTPLYPGQPRVSHPFRSWCPFGANDSSLRGWCPVTIFTCFFFFPSFCAFLLLCLVDSIGSSGWGFLFWSPPTPNGPTTAPLPRVCSFRHWPLVPFSPKGLSFPGFVEKTVHPPPFTLLF